ncbi:MAG: lysylphosphatidylglycerol synthase transmembrane domain-containing protein [Solirubrobacterales bacterium]
MFASGPFAAIDLDRQIDAFGRAGERFFDGLAEIGWGWLAAALVLSLGLQLCRARAWTNALEAAYPADRVSRRGVTGAFLVGAGMNGVLPARGGDAIKIVLAKRSVRDSSYPAIISSFAVLAPFDALAGFLVLGYAINQGLLPELPRLPELPAFDISFWAAHPYLLLWTLVAFSIGSVVLVAFIARRAEAVWQRLKQGVAILREPRRYLHEVAAWQLAAWLLRFASFWLFLEAFGIGGSAETVLLVMSVLAISGALPLTPGGAGAQQALLVATLEGPTRVAVLAYSVGQQVAVTAWSVAIAFITLGIIFRTGDWRALVREGRKARGEPAAP